MPSPVKIPVGCDTEFYDMAHAYARERGMNVSAVMREALIERMERERAAAPARVTDGRTARPSLPPALRIDGHQPGRRAADRDHRADQGGGAT